MKLLIKQARIADPGSSSHGQIQDIYLENGTIKEIGTLNDLPADQVIEIPGIQVSPGWADIFSQFCDPGLEFKETLETGASAAAAGGYTDVLVIPNTKPAIDTKGQVEYILQKSKPYPVQVHPLGAITRNTEGKELAEMYDMRSSGAIAFTDGLKPVQSSGLLVKALQYVRAFDGLLIQVPDDQSINPHGLMNEGVVSTRMGLSGKPAMAEELIVARDIKLARYAESRLHFTGVSSAKSIEYIRRAKESGINITCSVTPYHLYFTENDLEDYDTNLKVNPPLRSEKDREVLIQALRDGTIDTVASHHLPHEGDSKVTEFEYAKNGMTGLETTFSVLLSVCNGDIDFVTEVLGRRARQLFGLPFQSIEKGASVSLTLFNPETSWSYDREQVKSKSINSAFLGKTLKGRVAGIFNKDQLFLNP